jgi:hypothetical protein
MVACDKGRHILDGFYEQVVLRLWCLGASMYELYRYAEMIRASDLERISTMSDYIWLSVLNKTRVVVLRGREEICRTRFELRELCV